MADVGHGDAERSGRRGRIEFGRLLGGRLQQLERLAQLGHQHGGAWRGQHAGARAHEQRVVEQPPQPAEGQADGGLRQSEIVCGSADVSGLVDLVEDGQELHVHYSISR